MMPRLSTATLGVLCLTIGMFSSACGGVRPIRTLPNWVNNVYVPMATNETYEPGLEEVLTRHIQERFLADGRLGIVRKRDADLEVRTTITEFTNLIQSTDSDEIVNRSELRVTALVELFDPIDPSVPFATLPEIELSIRYNPDPRSVSYTVEPDRKNRAMERVARRVVSQTITGFPSDLAGLPDTVRASSDLP